MVFFSDLQGWLQCDCSNIWSYAYAFPRFCRVFKSVC